MIKELIVLKPLCPRLKEGFFKLDEAGFMTAAFAGENGEYMWIAGDDAFITGTFNGCVFKGKTSLNAINHAGVFLIENGVAYPMLYWGELNTVLKNFRLITHYSTEEYVPPAPAEPAVAAVEEPEIEKAEPPKAMDIIEDLEDTPDLSEFLSEAPPESYFECNKAEYLKMLEEAPEYSEMAALIPGSRWVRPKDENYIFGIIYDDSEQPLYLCYGFPLPWQETPPEKLEGYCQWIPISCLDPQGEGFWVIYINALTGERVK